MAKLFLDENGLQQYENAIIEAKNRLKIAMREKGEACEGNTNAWHDNADFDYAKNNEMKAVAEIDNLLNLREDIQQVCRGKNRSVIDIGDTVTVEINTPLGSNKTMTFLLSANYCGGKLHDGVMDITINSPLGKAIYLKKPAAFSYNTNNQTFSGTIVSFKN